MSLAIQRVQPVTVHDPRILQQERIFPVLKGGEQVLYKIYTTTSISSSSVTFHCPPPSSNLYVDRRIHLRMPVRVTIPAIASGVNDGVYVLAQNKFAIRSFPLQKAMETIQMTLNNQSMSINIGDMISALECYNTCNKLRAIDYSKCASYPVNQAQSFYQILSSERSGMTNPGSVQAGMPGKGCPWKLYSSSNAITAGNDTEVQYVDFVSCEPLFLSPLYWGADSGNDAGFYGLKTMDFTFNFNGNSANRMIAIDAVGLYSTDDEAARALTLACSVDFQPASFSWSESVPALLFQYITPQLVDRGNAMQQVLNYPYFNIERYPTDETTIVKNLGNSITINSTNVQLNSIPTKLYVFCRANNTQMQKNPYAPDAFYRLSQSAGSALTLQWGNRSGLLASASKQQLYDICVRAGCTLSYADWSGVAQQSAIVAAAGQLTASTVFYGTGSVIAIDPIDLGLDSISAPGKLDQITLQVSATWENPSKVTSNCTMYVVAVSAGIFTLFNGQASCLIGVLNSTDILNSHAQSESKMLNYFDTKEIYGGGFLNDLKSNLRHLRSKKVAAVEGGSRVSRQTLASRLQ